MSQFSKTALDIPYAENSNPRQTLDIAYPSVGNAPYKTILLFHGGAWMSGNKQSETIASIFQATTQGYAVVSVSYRLSDEVKWPKPLHDAKAAIRFIRANAGKYQLDTKNLVVWGASAGGHIAEMLAATNNQPAFEDLSMGNPNASSAVQGVISWYGIANVSTLGDAVVAPASKIMGFDVRTNKARTHDANPIELVTPRFPPILLVHGTNDQIVSYQQSVDMQKKVNEVTGKKTAQLVLYKGASHGDGIIKSKENVARCLNFVDSILFDGKNPYRSTNYMDVRTR
jgi:Esterase/lipase